MIRVALADIKQRLQDQPGEELSNEQELLLRCVGSGSCKGATAVVEVIAEIILQVLWWIIQFLAELLLQAIFEFAAELIGRSVKEPFRRPEPIHPWLAATGYAVFGAAAGGLSLWLLPTLFITAYWLRVANLALTPVVAGLLMARLGAWRKGRDQETIRLDTFAYGFLFALAMALVRFAWGR